VQITLQKIYKPTDKVIIIGGGPSFKNIDKTKLKGHPIIGVNAAFRLKEVEVPINFSGDCRFVYWNIKELNNYKGDFITCCQDVKNHKKFLYVPLSHEPSINPDDLSTIPWPYKNGIANSGASAICLAIKMGAQQIYLLGYDGGPAKSQHHWHHYHKISPRLEVYKRFNKFFKIIAKEAKELNIKIYNVNPKTKIPYFPTITPSDFYAILSS